MGQGQSRSQSSSSPFLSKPWREIKWGRDKQTVLQYMKDLIPPTKCQQIRILLHGPVGAGKSSFINSVQSAIRGRIDTQALVDNMARDSFTKRYKTYKISKGDPDTFYPFVFSDIMGLETQRGVLVDDIILALEGHVKEGYRFNPQSRLSKDDPFFVKSPQPSDKVHVLVCVVPANTASSMRNEIVQKIREIRMAASELGIPQVVLLTKIDEACPEIKEDLQNVYKVKYLKKEVEQFSAEVGVPINCIFPVKNYHSEINPNDDVDSLILSALTYIINYGEDYINFHMTQSEGLVTYLLNLPGRVWGWIRSYINM